MKRDLMPTFNATSVLPLPSECPMFSHLLSTDTGTPAAVSTHVIVVALSVAITGLPTDMTDSSSGLL